VFNEIPKRYRVLEGVKSGDNGDNSTMGVESKKWRLVVSPQKGGRFLNA
jgi:hypothetical protein